MDQVDTKYPKLFLKLTAKSTEEDAMMAYDEWAKTYEEVHIMPQTLRRVPGHIS